MGKKYQTCSPKKNKLPNLQDLVCISDRERKRRDNNVRGNRHAQYGQYLECRRPKQKMLRKRENLQGRKHEIEVQRQKT
ncbi:uncharacterized protein G2W53_023926 [Senna tora]|uniref:Uncharacterized protein n=1 Tax=Senna tora TaxID=362788 RepID=A0A834TBY2_9FABA|nr:uncharacterized protein G2W53_023926 [Senna tora]